MKSNRHPFGWRFLFVLALLQAPLAHAGPPPSTEVPEHHAEDPSAPIVSAANLLENERFWPYQTALTTAFQSLPAGSVGVLIRVDSAKTARIDFGRDGRFEVPVPATDVIERSNAIRLGKASKLAPNFVLALGPRLLDASNARGLPFKTVAAHRLFLCVFADPWRKEFGPLVAQISALRHPGLLTILFPQGRRPDGEVLAQLHAMQWTAPYLPDHFSDPYTKSLLSDGTALPAVMLQTAEGRVLFEARWSSSIGAKLAEVLDAQSARAAAAN